MKGDMLDATLLDSVMGHCARHNVPVNSLSQLTFIEVSKRLAETCQNDPKWIWASWEIRKYYDICHEGCHINRIQALMANDGVWPDGVDPYENASKAEAKIIPFPTNSTKH